MITKKYFEAHFIFFEMKDYLKLFLRQPLFIIGDIPSTIRDYP